jgi:hypothetical protein
MASLGGAVGGPNVVSRCLPNGQNMGASGIFIRGIIGDDLTT